VVKTLAQVPLFSSLPVEELAHLETAFPRLDFPAGKILLHEGQSDDQFYILLNGRVEIIKALGSAEERLLDVCEEGELLGEMSLFSKSGQHTASVRSLTALELIRVSRLDLDELMQRQPRLAYRIVRLLSQRLEESEDLTIHDLREKNRRLQEAYDELKAAQAQIIEKEKLEKELEISRQIQQSILPETLPRLPGYDLGALMIPARAVGGDFYSFFELPSNRLGLVVGDVSDKGVPAALFMALSYSLMRAEALRAASPVEALKQVNYHLLQMNASGMYVTLVYGVLDVTSGEFHYARAGHPDPYILDAGSNLHGHPLHQSQPLGLFEEPLIEERHITLAPGNLLLLYSDGVTEAMDASGNEFGIDSLRATLAEGWSMPAMDLCRMLWKSVQEHGGDMPQQDDFTTLMIRRLPAV
jgi:sigma-B regulation protein RsbU (phosphoserine phosphatase)